MTRDEALKLKDGDYVEALISGRWRLARVEYGRHDGGLFIAGMADCLYARRVGKTAAGRRFPRVMVWITDIRATEYRPEPANVFADFLDDAGHHEAAALLREAFPLGDRTP